MQLYNGLVDNAQMSITEIHMILGFVTLVFVLFTICFQRTINQRWHHYSAYATVGFLLATIALGIILALINQMTIKL
jgi:hypothetical protein